MFATESMLCCSRVCLRTLFYIGVAWCVVPHSPYRIHCVLLCIWFAENMNHHTQHAKTCTLRSSAVHVFQCVCVCRKKALKRKSPISSSHNCSLFNPSLACSFCLYFCLPHVYISQCLAQFHSILCVPLKIYHTHGQKTRTLAHTIFIICVCLYLYIYMYVYPNWMHITIAI